MKYLFQEELSYMIDQEFRIYRRLSEPGTFCLNDRVSCCLPRLKLKTIELKIRICLILSDEMSLLIFQDLQAAVCHAKEAAPGACLCRLQVDVDMLTCFHPNI